MKKPKQCPKCKSKKVVEIIYGFVPAPEPIFEGEEDSEYYGGCIVNDDSPRWHCNKCENTWGKHEDD